MESTVTPAYSGAAYDSRAQSPTISVGDWIITFVLMAIPFVNLVMIFVWAFGSSTPPSKANWAKAALLIYAIFIVLGFLFWGTIAAMIGMGSHHNYN